MINFVIGKQKACILMGPIVEMERKVKRKKEKVIISTEIESLVESLFLEEGEE